MSTTFKTYTTSLSQKKLPQDSLAHLREEAYLRFQDLGFPTRKDEAWKYIDINYLLNSAYATYEHVPLTEEQQRIVEGTFVEDVHRLTFLNGRFCEEYSQFDLSEKEVVFRSFESDGSLEAIEQSIQKLLAQKKMHAFALLNLCLFDQGLCLEILPQVKLSKPIHLLFFHADGDTICQSNPSLYLKLHEDAEASLFSENIDLDKGEHFSNQLNMIELEKGSQLEIVQDFIGHDLSTRFDTTFIFQKEKSHVTSLLYTQGGKVHRTESQVFVEAEKCETNLYGLTLGDKATQVYNHTTVHHLQPDSRSDQMFKNILLERSRYEFNGLVYVEKGADQTDSSQLNQNLILSDDAIAFSRPQLEIHADDVKCNHGSATGQLDEEAIFYLKTRGFRDEEAYSLLTFGFAEEIIEKIKTEKFRRRLECFVHTKLMKFKYNFASLEDK